MYEVDEVNAANRITNAYAIAWEKRYGKRPKIFTADTTFAKQLLMDIGEDASIELINHYLKMDNQYFTDRAFPFDVLRSNVNVVIASLGTRPKAAADNSLRMMWRIPCTTDNCNNHVEVTGTLGELNFAMNATKCNIHTTDEPVLLDDAPPVATSKEWVRYYSNGKIKYARPDTKLPENTVYCQSETRLQGQNKKDVENSM